MRIRGILKDDIGTRAKLVEKPAEQLDLLVHVLFTQGRTVELTLEEGRISGDPALALYVERCVEAHRLVPIAPDGGMVPVSLDDWESVASCVGGVMDPTSVEIENPEGEWAPTPI